MELPPAANRLIIAFAFLVSTSSAQVSPQGSVEGDVVDASTGQPILGARVSLRSGQDEPRFTIVDQNGHFQFTGLEMKMYQVTVRYPGMISVAQSALSSSWGVGVRLSFANPDGHVRVEMRSYSAISGRVTDSSGSPIEDAEVELILRYPLGGFHGMSGSRYEEGGYQYLGQRSVRTNDLGEYRLAPLPPGSYYLNVRPGASSTDSTDRSTFYPRALRPADATPVELPEGTQLRGIDIAMIREAGVSVSGTIRLLKPPEESFPGGAPRQYTSVLAWPVSQIGSGSFGSTVKGDRFEIHGLLPGKYVLEAATREPEDSYLRNPLAAARRVVDVGSDPVDGIQLIMAPVPELKGQVVFEPGCPATPLFVEARVDFHQGFPLSEVRTESDGRFVIKRLLPGRYTISLRAEGDLTSIRPASVKLGDAEDSGDGFEATADTRGPLLITVKCRPGRR
jgi:hypothetical protein